MPNIPVDCPNIMNKEPMTNTKLIPPATQTFLRSCWVAIARSVCSASAVSAREDKGSAGHPLSLKVKVLSHEIPLEFLLKSI